MTELAELNTRLDNLEDEVAEVRHIASGADKDVSDFRATLKGNTGVLNAIGETLGEHGRLLARHSKILARHGERLERLERKVDEGFRQTNENFATVEANFQTVMAGMEHITNLLTSDPSDES